MRWIILLVGCALVIFTVRRFIEMIRTGRLELNSNSARWNGSTSERLFFLLALGVHVVFFGGDSC